MRKAKTPPKRKPVLAGRRAAKRKAAKGSRAKVAKVAKPGNRARPAGKSGMGAAGNVATKAVKKVVSPVRATAKAAPATAKLAARPAAKPVPAAKANREGRDSKKPVQAERVAEKFSAGLPGAVTRSEGAAAAAKAAETAPVGLPTPIASFTI